MCRAPGSSSSTEYPGSLATSAQSSSASLPTSRDQRAHPLQLLQQGVLWKGAQRRGRRRGCAPPPATSGRTASAGSNFVVRTALGRRRPASILIQPGLAPSILSRRSSQTIHSESLLDPAQCFPLFKVWTDPGRLQEMRRRMCLEGGEDRTGRLLSSQNCLCFLSLSLLPASAPVCDGISNLATRL